MLRKKNHLFLVTMGSFPFPSFVVEYWHGV